MVSFNRYTEKIFVIKDCTMDYTEIKEFNNISNVEKFCSDSENDPHSNIRKVIIGRIINLKVTL